MKIRTSQWLESNIRNSISAFFYNWHVKISGAVFQQQQFRPQGQMFQGQMNQFQGQQQMNQNFQMSQQMGNMNLAANQNKNNNLGNFM
jgi:hypothetical protein